MILQVSYYGYHTMSIIIRRPRLDYALSLSGRKLLYGRRKTGKTFYVRHRLPDFSYYIVRPGGRFLDPNRGEDYDANSFIRICRLESNVVIDEFHRAEPILFDTIQAGECPTELVLLTSTLHYHRKFTEAASAPLKGLFQEWKVDLLSPVELLAIDEWDLEGRELVEHLVFYQEPSLVGWPLRAIIEAGRGLAHGLVGEVLEEEDYAYTSRFNAILSALAAGRSKLGEIAGYLYSRGLLPSPQTGLITKYLAIMARIGLLERIPIISSRRSVYRHASPLTYTIFYLEERYAYGDLPLSWGFLQKALRNIIPLLVERFFERFLAEINGLRPLRILKPYEIDIALAQGRNIKLVAEVKWTHKLARKEVRRIEAKLAQFEDAEKLLIVPDATLVPETQLKILDIKESKRIARRRLNKPLQT